MTQNNDLIEIGFVRAAHGLKGYVVIHAYSREADSLTQYGALQSADGKKQFKIKVINGKENDFLCAVDGVKDRNAAEALRGTKLFTPLANLPNTEDEDDFYIRDLIGLEARNSEGTTLGKVISLITVGAYDAVEIEFTHNGTAPLPKKAYEYLVFTKQNVPEVRVAEGYITVMLPEGLLTLPKETENDAD